VNKWLEIVVPVLLTVMLAGVANLYSRIEDLEKDTVRKELLEYRLKQLEATSCLEQ